MSIRKTLSIILLFTVLCGALQMLPFDLQNALHYHVDQLPSKLYYVWLTPHLIHLNTMHYLINILSLGAVLFTFRTTYTSFRFFLLFCFSAGVITLGLLCCSSDVVDYVGMSGVIYAILAAGLLWSRKKHPFLSLTLYTLIAGKIIYEQFYGPHYSIQNTLGEVVIVDAHFYGFFAGSVFVLLTGLLHKLSK